MNTLMTMKMKFTKNQKGLTLIELLAVIVILGVITAIAVPSVSGIISSTKTKADLATKDMIEAAVLNKVLSENLTASPSTTTIVSLVNEGYLAKVPVWNGTVYSNYTANYDTTTKKWTIAVAS